jgi:hypothetical protein
VRTSGGVGAVGQFVGEVEQLHVFVADDLGQVVQERGPTVHPSHVHHLVAIPETFF